MSRDQKDPASSSRATVTQSLDDILRGEAITPPLEASLDAPQIEQMLTAASRRFATKGMWTISATRVGHFTPSGRERLADAFRAFRDAGGETIIVWCVSASVSTVFISAAREAGGLRVKIVKNSEELKLAAKAAREARDRVLRSKDP